MSNRRVGGYVGIKVFSYNDYKGEFNLNLQHKMLMEKALTRCNGKTIAAARQNGIKHRTYLNMIRRHNINLDQFEN